MVSIKTVVDMMAAEAMDFRLKYKEIEKERDSSFLDLKENYVPNTQLFASRESEIEKNFINSKNKLIADSMGIFSYIDDLKKQETDRVSKINEKAIQKVRALEGIPLSEKELFVLADNMEISGDYYASRMLALIAEKNGIEFFDRALESSFEVKMNVLDQLKDHFNELLEQYPGDKYTHPKLEYAYFSTGVMERAVDLYNGKKTNTELKSAADRAYLNVKSKDTQLEKGLAIANVLKNAKAGIRDRILCKIAMDDTIGDSAVSLSGYAEEINDFKQGKAKKYVAAERLATELLSVKDYGLIQRRISENSDNPFLLGMLENEKKNSPILYDALNEGGVQVE